MFIEHWTAPSGGMHGYLCRFLVSNDATFQHIAVWTLLQLLESSDGKLIDTIKSSEKIMSRVQKIADRDNKSDGEVSDDEAADSEGMEAIALAQRCLEIIDGESSKKTLAEG